MAESPSSEIEINIYQVSKYNFEAHIGSTLERKILGTNDIVMDPLRFTYEKKKKLVRRVQLGDAIFIICYVSSFM